MKSEEDPLSVEQTLFLNLASQVAAALHHLKDIDRVTVRREDLGVKFVMYFNHANVINLSMVRLDGKDFFAPRPGEEGSTV